MMTVSKNVQNEIILLPERQRKSDEHFPGTLLTNYLPLSE